MYTVRINFGAWKTGEGDKEKGKREGNKGRERKGVGKREEGTGSKGEGKRDEERGREGQKRDLIRPQISATETYENNIYTPSINCCLWSLAANGHFYSEPPEEEYLVSFNETTSKKQTARYIRKIFLKEKAMEKGDLSTGNNSDSPHTCELSC